jgi:hypothetical protein
VVFLEGASHRVFRSTLLGLNQSIVGLSSLSETTYSTSHEIPMMEVDEFYACLIVWYNLACTRWLI